jgi:hypothetical protein
VPETPAPSTLEQRVAAVVEQHHHQLVELVRQAVDGELELLLEAELERNFLHG